MRAAHTHGTITCAALRWRAFATHIVVFKNQKYTDTYVAVIELYL